MRLWRKPSNSFKVRGREIQPRLLIPEDVMRRLHAYVDASEIEVGGFGLIERTSSATFLLYHVYTLPQVASPVHVEFDPLALNQKDSELVEHGLYEQRRFQWHSHGYGQAYFSVVDVRNILRREEDWHISMVLNKLGHFEARLDLNLAGGKRERPLTVTILLKPDKEIWREAREEVERNLRPTRIPNGPAANLAARLMKGRKSRES